MFVFSIWPDAMTVCCGAQGPHQINSVSVVASSAFICTHIHIYILSITYPPTSFAELYNLCLPVIAGDCRPPTKLHYVLSLFRSLACDF